MSVTVSISQSEKKDVCENNARYHKTKTGTFTPWKGKKLTQSTYKSNWHFLCESCKTNLKRWFASSSTSSSEQLGNLFCNSSDICNTTWNLENNKFTQRKGYNRRLICVMSQTCTLGMFTWGLVRTKSSQTNNACLRVWARPRHCANPALQLQLSL